MIAGRASDALTRGQALQAVHLPPEELSPFSERRGAGAVSSAQSTLAPAAHAPEVELTGKQPHRISAYSKYLSALDT